MGMSEVYGPADRGESIATIHAALDAGITLLDTGDFYAMGHNEMLVRDAAPPANSQGSTRGRPQRGTSLPIRCSGSAPITSTSTVPRGSIPTFPSRKRSAASPNW
jgi:hypothetical protein